MYEKQLSRGNEFATCPALTGALRLTAKADWERFRQGLSAIPPASLAGPELWTEVDVRE